MAIIRRLNCFDAPKIKKTVSYPDEKFSQSFSECVFDLLNSMLPLKYKFLTDSYVLVDNNEILGLISVVSFDGNPYKINITRLIFKQNYYDAGKQLVEFVIARYGAKGAISFTVTVDQSHEELINLFMEGCGFRHCSFENLWKLDNFIPQTDEKAPFRHCQNNDAKDVAMLYNAELKPHYKPSLLRDENEYKEPLFAGLKNFYKNRYVLESSCGIAAYLSVTTSDNFNFIIDISLNNAYEISYDAVINFALGEISNKKTKFCAFMKHRQYTINADNFEKYLHERNLNCIQTQCVLVKDFYKPVKQTENPLQIFRLGEFSSN